MLRKVHKQQTWRPPTASEANTLAMAGEAYLAGPDGKPLRQQPLNSCVLQVKNSSGAARRGGDLLQLDASLVTTLDANHLWLDGVAPAAPLWQKMHGILVRQTPSTQIGDCQVSGVCLAYVNVTDAGHYRCDAKAAQYTLESAFAGPWQIAYKPSGTGEKLCVVILGPKVPSTALGKLAGSLSAGSVSTATSASCTLYRRNKSTSALESAVQTVTAWSWYATAFSTNDYFQLAQDQDGDWWVATKDCT